MKSLAIVLFTLSAALINVGGVVTAQQYNANDNSYWPMRQPSGSVAEGRRWVYQTESTDSARNGLVAVFEVLSSPSTFGCLAAGVPASSPFQIGLFKTDPRTYWNINTKQHLRWMLGVQPTGYTPTNLAGSLFSMGWYRTDLGGQPLYQSTVNLRSNTPLTNLPYLLLRSAGGTSPEFAYQAVYAHSDPTPNYGCSSTVAIPSAQWSVQYTANQYYSTPAYTGYHLKAQYDEINNPGGSPVEEYMEDWYFAPNIGPTVIHTHKQFQVVPELVTWQRLKLVEYQPNGDGSPLSAQRGITLRDSLIGQAGTTSGLNWWQWMYYFAKATNLATIDPYYACVSNPATPMSVNTFLSYVETIGGTCGTLVYPQFSNGTNANSALQAMVIAASYAPRLDWDHWNYYLETLSGMSGQGQAPHNVCMPAVELFAPQYVNVNPNRYLLLSPRQWLLYYMHYYIPSTLPCAGPV
jgi:hypothetical protein